MASWSSTNPSAETRPPASPAANSRSESLIYPSSAAIDSGGSSTTLTVPPAAQGGYVVEVAAAGTAAGTVDAGVCLVGRRVHLTVR